MTRLSEGYISVVKPEISAPGVGILAENAYGLQRFDGTSFATPFVTGAAAILMERAILGGIDPYLYDAVIIGLRRKTCKTRALKNSHFLSGSFSYLEFLYFSF